MSAAPDVSDDDLPRAFGSYLLLQNFARGGMGEVYLAKSGGIAGLERTCVVKKLRAELTRDREYVTRFIDEARVVVTLNHANICNVFDVGRVLQSGADGDVEEYYLAMEYVSGRDVRTLQDRCRKHRIPASPATCIHLVCETLQALDYAHRRRHPVTGEPLNLVHRDVSPQNVLVSYEGEVKLIDFGLAASRLKVERTQPNVVMGKMAYMAPEQARGDPIDARADLFACGVLAYEMLTNERFYEGMTANDIWQVAGRGGFVPRAWGSLDPPLASIVSRGLHPDARRRFATCGEFREALLSYSHERWPGAGASAMRALMEEVFAEEMARERAALARFGTITIAAFQTEIEATKSHAVTLVKTDGDEQSAARLVKDELSDLQGGDEADATQEQGSILRPMRGPSDDGTPITTPRPEGALVPGPDDETRLDAVRPVASPPRSRVGIHEERTVVTNPSQRAFKATVLDRSGGRVRDQDDALAPPPGERRPERTQVVRPAPSHDSVTDGIPNEVTSLDVNRSRRTLWVGGGAAVALLLIAGAVVVGGGDPAGRGDPPPGLPLEDRSGPAVTTTSPVVAPVVTPVVTVATPPLPAPTPTTIPTTIPTTVPTTIPTTIPTTTPPATAELTPTVALTPPAPAPPPVELAPLGPRTERPVRDRARDRPTRGDVVKPPKPEPAAVAVVVVDDAFWAGLAGRHPKADCVTKLIPFFITLRSRFIVEKQADIRGCAERVGYKKG